MNFRNLLNTVLTRTSIFKDKPLLLPSKRYIAITLTLAQILKLNRKIYDWNLYSLQQAVQIEQWFLHGWEREKERLCHASMKALEQSFAQGSLPTDPAAIEYFLDLRALEFEGHHNQVLNDLYGRGEAIFDALVYPGSGLSKFQQ
jgi:hypothetical protein